MCVISARVKGLVVALAAVERGLAGAGGKRDQRAFAGLHLGKALSAPRRCGSRSLDLGGKRIVAAGIEEHQLDLGVAHGLVERQVDVDRRAELDVHLGFDVGVDRQQVVGAADRDAVAGVEEHGDVGALRALAEIEQLLGHLVAGEVGAFDDLEADIAQRGGHRLGVHRRVRKLGHVLVGAVADHEGDALVGKCAASAVNNMQIRERRRVRCASEIPWESKILEAATLQQSYTKIARAAPQKMSNSPTVERFARAAFHPRGSVANRGESFVIWITNAGICQSRTGWPASGARARRNRRAGLQIQQVAGQDQRGAEHRVGVEPLAHRSASRRSPSAERAGNPSAPRWSRPHTASRGHAEMRERAADRDHDDPEPGIGRRPGPDVEGRRKPGRRLDHHHPEDDRERAFGPGQRLDQHDRDAEADGRASAISWPGLTSPVAGRTMTTTPTMPSTIAAALHDVIRSPRKLAARIAVQIGMVNSIATTCAIGISVSAKNQPSWAP